jgi:hypothetical protein
VISAMNNTEQQQADAEWAEDLALRILLAHVRPERQAEGTERLRSLVRELEGSARGAARRLPRMAGARRDGGRARGADRSRESRGG